MKEKIGLILSIRGINYGMLLQSYATQYYLDKSGFDTEVLVLKRDKSIRSVFNHVMYIFRPMILKVSLSKRKRKKLISQTEILSNAYKTRKADADAFVRERFHNIIQYDSISDAREKSSSYYAIIIGSDQQWTPGAFFTDFNTLMFVSNNIKKISYATSLGVSKIPRYCYKRGKEFLERIDYISVREASGKNIIQQLVDKEVSVVLDPTFLITTDDWKELIPESLVEKEPYIFCYFLGDNEENMKMAADYASRKGIKSIFIRNLETYSGTIYDIGDVILDSVTPEKFINYIRGAEVVFTDSFHGTVFSIINSRKFVTFYRTKATDPNSRNSRIDDLLLKLNLTDRVYVGEMEILEMADKNIDYHRVHSEIDIMRNYSMDFLDKALKA